MTRVAKTVRAFTGAKQFWNESPDPEKHRFVRILVGVALLVAGAIHIAIGQGQYLEFHYEQ